ncbi:hypothetical protein LCGC14_1424930 [marine sediment metagenome]|uniref:HNH nuclease domain-containing protein n=1 Tax=marine sediment metagenome TaxID=412755 RepID=A0A0F9JQP3_9ZZZZ
MRLVSTRKFWSLVDIAGPKDCWEWQSTRWAFGYGYYFTGVGRPERAHVIAYCLHHGLEPEDLNGLLTCHSCDNPPCCNPAHLWLGTRADNNRDCREKDRQNCGRNGRKRSEQDIKEIRELFTGGIYSAMELSGLYGTSISNLYSIVRWETWKML